MAHNSFVHLRLRSDLTIANSTVRLSEVLQFAKNDSQVALALTDLDNLFGAVKFCRTARSYGIKPIVGCDLSLGSEDEFCGNVVVLAKSPAGYKTLCKLLTTAQATNKIGGCAFVQKDWLLNGKLEDLIILSGAFSGDIGRAILAKNTNEAERLTGLWVKSFPGNFYIELQRFGHSGTTRYNIGALDLATAFGVPVVATHPTQFLRRRDFGLHEVKSCVFTGETVACLRRQRRFTDKQFFMTQREMHRLFSDVPIALSNTIEVAKQCNLVIGLGVAGSPSFATITDESLRQKFLLSVVSGLGILIKKGAIRLTKRRYQIYRKRLLLECEVIFSMGFLEYFLVVTDFVAWAKAQKIPVGPGRGSGAGSVVSFALGVTEVEPIRHELLFERFLNPERITMPDLDVDFCQDRRDQVIRYVRAKYGTAKVAQITTIGSFAARTAIRDAGRVLNVGYSVVNEISKLIPIRANTPVTVAKALRLEPKIQKRCAADCAVRLLVGFAVQLEGLVRNVAVHAGGLLIVPSSITSWCAVYSQYDTPSDTVSQLDKDAVEDVGLTKFDLLGLTTLTIVESAVCYIRQHKKSANWSLQNITLTDQLVFQLLSEGNTAAIFQFESQGMRSLLRLAKPKRLKDVVALIALYRPGPISLTRTFLLGSRCNQKQTSGVATLDAILSETHGALLFQEQVMRIVQTFGGYTLGEADLFRRAISKKQTDVMPKHRKRFVLVAGTRGLSSGRASAIFQAMEKFAGYGFNKSHATAYASLSYQTSWLKAHYPIPFLASSLSYSFGDPKRLQRLRNDCTRRGITLLPPDINRSFYRFSPGRPQAGKQPWVITFGFGAIKGGSRNSVTAVLRERANRPFTGIQDFCERTDRLVVGRRLISALIRVGAFDGLHGVESRAGLILLLPQTLKRIVNQQMPKGADIGSFVRISGHKMAELIGGATTPYSSRRRTLEEHKGLGFYYTSHPFRHYEVELRQVVKKDLFSVRDVVSPKATISVCGVITELASRAHRGKPAVGVLIEDDTGQCTIIVPQECPQCDLMVGEPIVATGVVRITWRRIRLTLVASSIQNLTQIRSLVCTTLTVKCPRNVLAVAARKAISWFSSSTGSTYNVWIRVDTAFAIGFSCQFICSVYQVATHISHKAFPSEVFFYYC